MNKEEILRKYNIDQTKLKRDYVKNPFVPRTNDVIPVEDLKYLYEDLRLNRFEMAFLIGISEPQLSRKLIKVGIRRLIKKTALEKLNKIINNYKIDLTKLKRNYIENPLVRIANHKFERPLKEDFYYLYYTLNIDVHSLAEFFGVKRSCLQNFAQEFQIKKGRKKTLALMYETNMKRYGTKNPRISKQESLILNLLRGKFEDVKHEYKSELYPFHCDFYIPEKDLYIEYQGHWSHGPLQYHEPYNPFNKGHTQLLKTLKLKMTPQYERTIYNWTIRDPLKREIAKKNKLNWIEFFTIEEFMTWYNQLN